MRAFPDRILQVRAVTWWTVSMIDCDWESSDCSKVERDCNGCVSEAAVVGGIFVDTFRDTADDRMDERRKVAEAVRLDPQNTGHVPNYRNLLDLCSVVRKGVCTQRSGVRMDTYTFYRQKSQKREERKVTHKKVQ